MSDTSDTAEQAKQVGSQAADSAGQVAQTAASETRDVAAQAVSSARDLVHQVRGEVGDQAGTQQQRIASGLSDLADQLEEMGRDQSGLAASLVGQVADRTRTTADWLSTRGPDEVLEEARRFAARRPGTFLAAAAAVGFLGARLTRGLGAASSGLSPSDHLPERSFPPAPRPVSSLPPVEPQPYGDPQPVRDRGLDDVDELGGDLPDLPGLPEDPGAPLDTPPGRAPGVTPPVAPRVGGGGEML